MEVVALADAHDDSRFGAKATGLGAAARSGLPIPPGIALSGSIVDAGLVIPDSFRIEPSGAVLDRMPGVKKIAIRAAADGGTLEQTVAPERVEQLCLDDDQLAQLNALAERCEQVYGPARDIEWAF